MTKIKIQTKWIVLASILLALFLINKIILLYTEILWYQEVGYLAVYLKTFLVNWGFYLVRFLLIFSFFLVNLLLIKKALLKKLQADSMSNVINIDGRPRSTRFGGRITNIIIIIIFVFISIVLTAIINTPHENLWQDLLFYLKPVQFDLVDPILSVDVAFYVFQFPFLRSIYELAIFTIGFTLLITFVFYAYIGWRPGYKLYLNEWGQKHLTALLSLFLLLKAWGYRLDRYKLLFNREGVVFGPGYTDAVIRIPVMNFLSYLVFAFGIIVLISIFLKYKRHVIYIIGLWLVLALGAGTIYPSVVQKFYVEPNEINYESTYIKNNIKFTNIGFGTDKIIEKEYHFQDGTIKDNWEKQQPTLKNIRIWDWRPILQAYKQLEERRPYYVFERVDIDRYLINGEQRQVMLAPRELDQDLLPNQAQTWINKTLKYTHGLGVVMSPVNSVTSDGFPDFYLRDIPPIASVDIELNNNSIYYGEKSTDYVIVNHADQEFHYPRGNENIYIDYDGTGGIPIANKLRRLAFAWKFKNFRILMAGDITENSRLMFDRIIYKRLQKIAPFLRYDNDPYIVIHEGRIFWLQDAYTTSRMFPYSEPYGNWGNYVRNTVKVVIDAYNGSIYFYLIDPEDPLAKAYSIIFPDLFLPVEEMPSGLKNHWRYPEDYFLLQSKVLSTYHMTDYKVFYNKEDQWAIPNERYGNDTIVMSPYYTLMQLPGQEKLNFLVLLPFTPVGRNNMVAWMAGLCDPDNYGELVIYHFPKDRLVFGPMQIEAQIDQDDEIARLISLWDQKGSKVIRGNLMVIPLEGTILYVEPVFLQSEQTELPQLRRIIIVSGDNIVMEETFEQAILKIVGQPAIQENRREHDSSEHFQVQTSGEIKLLALEAESLLIEIEKALQKGDWAQYGDLQTKLKMTIAQLANLVKEDREP